MSINPDDPQVTTNAIMNTSDECWRRYLQGEDIRSIAATIDQPISAILERLERMLQQSIDGSRPPSAHLDKLIDELHLVRRAAWMGWQRSLKHNVKIVTKTVTGSKSSDREEKTTTTEIQSGNASCLRIIIDCNRREAILRGLDKSSRTATPEGPTSKIDLEQMLTQMEAALRSDQKRPA